MPVPLIVWGAVAVAKAVAVGAAADKIRDSLKK
jgi:hypothetical protein